MKPALVEFSRRLNKKLVPKRTVVLKHTGLLILFTLIILLGVGPNLFTTKENKIPTSDHIITATGQITVLQNQTDTSLKPNPELIFITGFILLSFWCSLLGHYSLQWDMLPVAKKLIHVLQEDCIIHIGCMHPSPNIILTAVVPNDPTDLGMQFVGSFDNERFKYIIPELEYLEAELPDQIFWVR